jgi:hypothetical protein
VPAWLYQLALVAFILLWPTAAVRPTAAEREPAASLLEWQAPGDPSRGSGSSATPSAACSADPEGSWTFLSTEGSSHRSTHSAVWTGEEMIIWGGSTGGEVRGDGAAYDPRTDTWRQIATEGTPAPRGTHSAVWTGEEMIIWGGSDWARDERGRLQERAPLGGAAYDPWADRWRPVSSDGALPVLWGHQAVWTGDEMIVWQRRSRPGDRDWARYHPRADTWRPMSPLPAPMNVDTLLWTGTHVIAVGRPSGGNPTVAHWDPSTDAWTMGTTEGAPDWRMLGQGNVLLPLSAVWTGELVLLWGSDGFSGRSVGGVYDPAADAWRPMAAGAPAIGNASTVWTGREMVIWGGSWTVVPARTARWSGSGKGYDPATDSWRLYGGLGHPRSHHTAVWTGTEMLIFGGGVVPGGVLSGGSRDRDEETPGVRYVPPCPDVSAAPD